MFNNPNLDEDLCPDETDQSIEVGMRNVETTKFLEVDKSWRNPYIINLQEINDNQELFDKFYYIWTNKYRRKNTTVINYINDLKRMTYDDYLPVDLLKPNPAQIIAYLDLHEDKDHPYRTIDPWKATKALYKMCGIDTELWGYIPPSPPPPKVMIIPLPYEVKKITSHKYSKNRTTNETIQKLLYIGFLLGLRPQEYPLVKIEDIYLDQGYMIITEPKKHFQRRQIFPERELLTNDRRKSIKNQIKLHDKINPENPYLFIQPNTGNRWTTNHLRHWISNYVKTIYPSFSMKVMRHWCAIARLIQTKVETGTFDVWQVKEWLGHDRIKTTQSYIRYAEKYYKIASYDWIRTLLKPLEKWEQKRSETENYIKQPWFRVETTGVERYSPDQSGTGFLLLEKLIKINFLANSTSHFKTFPFFSFDQNGGFHSKFLIHISPPSPNGTPPPFRTKGVAS